MQLNSSFDRFAGYAAAFAVLAAAAFCLRPAWLPSHKQRLLRQAAWALACDDPLETERIIGLALAQSPRSSWELLVAGRAASRLQQSESALVHFQQVPDDGGYESLLARLESAKRQILIGQAAAAERNLRRVLDINPFETEALERLTFLLQAEGRTWESMPYLERLIRQGRFAGEHLLMAGSPGTQFLRDPQFAARCRTAAPRDPPPLLVEPRVLISRNQNGPARAELERVVARHPNQLEAQAELGQLFAESGNLSGAFVSWNRELPKEADDHPVVWYARGLGAKQAGQLQAAARCFWEALKRHPNHPGANYQLSQTLVAVGKKTLAEPFSRRAAQLGKIELLLVEAKADTDARRHLCETLKELGRPWEVAGWSQIAWQLNENADWARENLRQLHVVLASEPPFTLAEANPALRLDLSAWPLPQFSAPESEAESRPNIASAAPAFVDSAADAGLDFVHYNGADPEGRRAYMFEFSGGGVAVLDFDNDGWPDLYFTQGCEWPAGGAGDQHRDRLYRNIDGRRFEDVTDEAGLGDDRFGQGSAIGDFNNDGFPDIYLGNIGRDRLYQNNGDGTFRDVSAESGIEGEQWTSSCVVADFNGDSVPDIFLATYLAGPEVFERECVDRGKPTQCAPALFDAEEDKLYLGLGDGRFEDVSAEAGILAPDGKGLGVVAGDFDGSRRLSLMVSNDTTANFFFLNQTPARGDRPHFLESGIACGLGLDEAGKAQACMGIAAGDANQDGRLDLFVTNFFRESNTLYLQQPERSFVDGSRKAGLRDPSYDMLGWGTQFIDADLDGAPDLFVLNGHLNDFSAIGVPYRMPAQFFRNLGDGRFRELPGASLGPYFGERRLGRALARFDWNRDGREDVGATHVGEGAALLTNKTPRQGRYLAVHLRGVRSDRDAIGATLQVSLPGRTLTRQLTAGDGFQASNERKLIIGLGDADSVPELIIRWPSGLNQKFYDLAADHEIICVEGASAPMVLPRSPSGATD